MEILEEPQRLYLPTVFTHKCAQVHALTHMHMDAHRHTHILWSKKQFVSPLGFPIPANSTTTLPSFIFQVATSVFVKLFWHFQKYCDTFNVDRLPQEWVRQSSGMCLTAIILTLAFDAGYWGPGKSGPHLILWAETLKATIAKACVAGNLGMLITLGLLSDPMRPWGACSLICC